MWLSEVMLQQTTVATVTPRFERFVARWPTVEELAAASDAEILSEWAGLGYYARARNLIACAREVAERGGFPASAAELRKLPGLGVYTSAAMAAIAFGEKAPAVDTNVERVIARVRGLSEPDRGEIERQLLEWMDGHRPGDIVQAMMDLGATICRPKQPRCVECPLSADCAACASGQPDAYPGPARAQAAAASLRHGILDRTRRPGLAGPPPAQRPARRDGRASRQRVDRQRPAGSRAARHRPPRLHPFLARPRRSSFAAEPVGEGWWHPIPTLGEAGLPTLYRRAAELALASVPRRRAAA